MTTEPRTVTLDGARATITIDLAEFAQRVWYDADDEERHSDHLVDQVARLIAKDVKKDVTAAVRDRVATEVETIVRDTLTGPVQPTDSWGNPRGEPTTLHAMIQQQANDALRKAETRDGYTRGAGRTMVQRIIEAEMGSLLAKDLKPVIDEARKEAREAVKNAAATLIGETIDRARRGLV